jgi:hypothetical protein
MSPWYTLDRRLGGPQSRSGSGGEEKNPWPYRKSDSDRPVRNYWATQRIMTRVNHFDWEAAEKYEDVSKSFRTESISKYTFTTIKTRWEATQRVTAAKLTILTHKIAIQMHLVAESWYHLQFSLPETFGYILVHAQGTCEVHTYIRQTVCMVWQFSVVSLALESNWQHLQVKLKEQR